MANQCNNQTNDGEKANLLYLKFKIFILIICIIYKINKYQKSIYTVKAFQDFFRGVKFL